MNTQAVLTLLTHPPIDWVIFLVIAIILLVDSLRSGTGRASAVALAAPASYFLYTELELGKTFILSQLTSSLNTTVLQAGLLAGIFVLTFFLFHRIMYSFGGSSASPLQSILSSLSATVVLIVMWVHVPVLESVWHFSSQFQSAFGATYAFLWVVVAYLALAFVRS